MKLNDFFDKIYCINLKERLDRWEVCDEQFKNLSIDVERYEGKKGEHVNNLKPGEVGLIKTNIEIIKNAKANGHKNILIFEDDVLFIDNFNKKFESKIEYLPKDYNVIHLGGNHHFFRGEFKCISKEINHPITVNNYKNLDYEICSTIWSQTTHAVGINESIYDVLLEKLSMFTKQTDMIYCNMQASSKYKMYAFTPSLCLQRASYSDILGKHVDYNNNLHFF